MACQAEHIAWNFGLVSAAAYAIQTNDGKRADATPIAAGAAAACLPSLPDWIEPAVHPNHRQFFHSVAFGALVGYGVYRTWHWAPQDDWGKLARIVALVGGSAYLAHLARDAFTTRSLPMI